MTKKIKPKLYAVAVSFLFITACQPNLQDYNSSKETDLASSPVSNSSKKESKTSIDMVYVTAIDTDDTEGNAAAYRGVLNVRNGCLFIDNLLVVLQSPNLKWEQNPFKIYYQGNGEKFKLGDIATLGGSSENYSIVNREDTLWKNPPIANCKSERIWSTVSISSAEPLY